jgi:SDR family mycofactocin-dependent oxidoreductase
VSEPGRPRVALVTGAARGIGAATVHRLCRDGYRVVAVDIADAEVTAPGIAYPLAGAIDLRTVAEGFPGQVVTYRADVRDLAALQDAADLAVDRFGRLDAAVAAAAVIIGGQPLWETPSEHLQTLLDIDVVGVWNTATAVVPRMLESDRPDGCRFVAVASAAGSYGLFRLAGYNVAKHAVIGLVRGLAADLVGTGLTAVAVSPGSTGTHMLQATAQIYGLDDVSAFVESSPLRRILHPDELAATIAFCCSLEGAALHGSVVEASGGFRG